MLVRRLVQSFRPLLRRNYVVLGVETSCDDTGVAIVTSDRQILGQSLASQVETETYGGVKPNVAAREHRRNLPVVLSAALKDANVTVRDVDALAVTVGPGLSPCLYAGVNAVTSLARDTQHQVYPVNHLEGHVLTARLYDEGLEFPFMVLLVSGGHCQILVAHGVGNYSVLGTTLDDSLGEAFDKTARLLGLGPFGSQIEALAKIGDPERFTFPTPMLLTRSCDFSFSGLKSAVRKTVDELPAPLSESDKADLAADFQRAAFSHIENKTARALRWAKEHEQHLSALVLCGGVARNEALRALCSGLAADAGLGLCVPPPSVCTDNGVMIAWAALEHYLVRPKVGRAVGAPETFRYRDQSEVSRLKNWLGLVGR